MARPQFKVTIPKEWEERKKTGLCPVCSNPREEFEKNRKVYCSEKCAMAYASHFVSWGELREKIIERDKETCVECGDNHSKIMETHKKLVDEKIKELNEQFKDILEAQKFKELAEAEKSYLNKIERIGRMNVSDYSVKHKIQDAYGIKIPDAYYDSPSFRLEVDHIIAICNGGDMWDEDNLRTLCNKCHKKKTKKDFKDRKRKKLVGDGKL